MGKDVSRKKKALKIITILIVLILISMIAWIIYTIAKNPLLVSQDSFIVEYGNEISVNPSDYLSEQVKKEIITKTKVNVNTNSRDEKNQYPVGEYEVILNYIHHKAIAIVIVKDTTCPQIKIPQSPIEIEEGKLSTDDFKNNYEHLFTVEDLSETNELKFDLMNVNANEVGEYEAVANCEDEWGNKAEEKFKIKIIEKPKIDNETLSKESESSKNTSTSSSKKKSSSKETTNNASSNNSSTQKENTGSSKSIKIHANPDSRVQLDGGYAIGGYTVELPEGW